jgi:Macrocin-O-methyltransferase (TylF)
MPLSEDWKEAPKLALTRLGAHCSQPLIYSLNGAFNYLHIGWWLRANGFDVPVRVRTRYQLFDLVAAEVGDRDVLYMEFGVHAGVSIRYWSQLLTSPAAKLHGFDSFVGLPHDWTLEGHPRGYFSTDGAVPIVDDPRISFFAGWFEDTLPAYEWPEHDVLVVMLDADLYSSTSTVLAAVRDHLVPGSFLYFDQLHHRADELRAFAELIDEHRDMRFRIVGATRELSSVLFQRID